MPLHARAHTMTTPDLVVPVIPHRDTYDNVTVLEGRDMTPVRVVQALRDSDPRTADVNRHLAYLLVGSHLDSILTEELHTIVGEHVAAALGWGWSIGEKSAAAADSRLLSNTMDGDNVTPTVYAKRALDEHTYVWSPLLCLHQAFGALRVFLAQHKLTMTLTMHSLTIRHDDRDSTHVATIPYVGTLPTDACVAAILLCTSMLPPPPLVTNDNTPQQQRYASALLYHSAVLATNPPLDPFIAGADPPFPSSHEQRQRQHQEPPADP